MKGGGGYHKTVYTHTYTYMCACMKLAHNYTCMLGHVGSFGAPVGLES